MVSTCVGFSPFGMLRTDGLLCSSSLFLAKRKLHRSITDESSSKSSGNFISESKLGNPKLSS